VKYLTLLWILWFEPFEQIGCVNEALLIGGISIGKVRFLEFHEDHRVTTKASLDHETTACQSGKARLDAIDPKNRAHRSEIIASFGMLLVA